MKLYSFEVRTPVGTFTRVGALLGQKLVDLNMAYARMLADRNEAQPYRLANAVVPATMLELLEGGASAMAAARQALDYASKLGDQALGPRGRNDRLFGWGRADHRPSAESAVAARFHRL